MNVLCIKDIQVGDETQALDEQQADDTAQTSQAFQSIAAAQHGSLNAKPAFGLSKSGARGYKNISVSNHIR